MKLQNVFSACASLVRHSLCALLLVAIGTVGALAQAPVGTISGTVLDQSGAVVPNASVTIKNKATGSERKLSSDSEGNFAAPALQAGEYEVTAQAKGFRTLLREFTVATGSVIKAEMQIKPDFESKLAIHDVQRVAKKSLTDERAWKLLVAPKQ